MNHFIQCFVDHTAVEITQNISLLRPKIAYEALKTEGASLMFIDQYGT